MTDATVSSVGHDEPLKRPAERDVSEVPATAPGMPRALLALWLFSVVLLVVFLLFGSVRIGAGNWIGRRMDVAAIWSRFLDFLTEQGAAPAVVTIVVLAAAVALAGGAVAVLLAFAMRDDVGHPVAGDRPDR